MADPQFSGSSIGNNQYLQQYLATRLDGKSMRQLRLEMESKIQAMEVTGQLKPATILNFNPVPLVTDGGIAQVVPKVPSIIDEAVRHEDKLEVMWRNKKYRATILTIRRGLPFPWIKDCQNVEGEAIASYNPAVCKQIEMAYSFYASYSSESVNSSAVGGVIVFEGDRHVLDRINKPDFTISVPKAVRLPNGDSEYTTEPLLWEEALDNALTMQKRYARGETQAAQNYWDQEDQRGNITPIHRVWHQFEIDMGYRHTPAPWVTLQGEVEVTCEGCGTPKKRANAFFCHQCQRPYDPLVAYMAGEIPVSHPHMNRIKDADWAKVRVEEIRRKKLRQGIPMDKPEKAE